MKKAKQKKLPKRNILVVELFTIYSPKREKKRKGKGSYKRKEKYNVEER